MSQGRFFSETVAEADREDGRVVVDIDPVRPLPALHVRGDMSEVELEQPSAVADRDVEADNGAESEVVVHGNAGRGAADGGDHVHAAVGDLGHDRTDVEVRSRLRGQVDVQAERKRGEGADVDATGCEWRWPPLSA